MQQQKLKVNFAYGTAEGYRLIAKRKGTIYFITDTPAIYYNGIKFTSTDDFVRYISEDGIGGKLQYFIGEYLNQTKTLSEILGQLPPDEISYVDFVNHSIENAATHWEEF